MEIHDDADRSFHSGRRANTSDDDEEEDVLSLYAQSDYELDTVFEKSNEPTLHKKSPRKSGKTEKSKDDQLTTSNRYDRSRHSCSYQERKKERLESDSNRFVRGNQLKRGRDSKNAYVNIGRVSVDSTGNRNPSTFSTKQHFFASRRGILGDAPVTQHSSAMNQNQNPRVCTQEKYFSNQSSRDTRRNVFENDATWQNKFQMRAGELGRLSINFRGMNARSSILGDGSFYHRRILDRVSNENNESKRRNVSKRRSNQSNRRNSGDSFQGNFNEDLVGSTSLRQHRNIESDRYNATSRNNSANSAITPVSNKDAKKSGIKSCSDRQSKEKPKSNKGTMKEFNKASITDFKSIADPQQRDSSVMKTKITSCNVKHEKDAEITDTSPKSPELQEEALPPVKKSRINLLPSPVRKSVSQWVLGRDAKVTVSSTLDNEFIENPGKQDKIDISTKLLSEKTSIVAPLASISSASGSLEQSDSSEIIDDPESQPIDFLERMVTPPIEVTYSIDAPPRPPNPGPIHLASSNSNSPAASRPSSRSGRFAVSDNTRSVTPDVPPRPVNPPPPISAPSPASTPEGMPPRPQNPGPPLDITLSTMSRPSISTNSSHAGDRVVTFANSIPGLIPLPIHSKLQTPTASSELESESTSTHSRRISIQHEPSLCNSNSSDSTNNKPFNTTYSTYTPNPNMERRPEFSAKISENKQISTDQRKQRCVLPNNSTPIPCRSDQSDVIDLSKTSSVSSSTSMVSRSEEGIQQNKIEQDAKPLKDEVHMRPKSVAVDASASLSFSTNVVSSNYPVQSSYLTAINGQNSAVSFLPKPNGVERKLDESEKNHSTAQLEESVSSEDSESVLKEKIITCFKNEEYSKGLNALKDAMSKMPEKFGDSDVYEVIEFFGQNEAFGHVVTAARLVRAPDVRLLEFLLHIIEQSPESLKEKDSDLWLIFNQVLGVNPSSSVVDVFVKCFAAIGNWNKVWTGLRMYPSSICLPHSTISLCLQGILNGEDKHLQTGVMFVYSLPDRVKRALDVDVLNSLWLSCAEKGLTDVVEKVDQVRNLVQQSPDTRTRLTNKVRTLLMEMIVGGKIDSLLEFVDTIGFQYCQQYLDCFTTGFMVMESPILKIGNFLRELKQSRVRLRKERAHEVFAASLCVMVMRYLSQRQSWADAFELWRLSGELGMPCERASVLENESQTSIALLCLEICVRHGSFDTAVSMLSESLVLGQPWNDVILVRRRLCILQEIYYRTVDTRLDFAGTTFKALLSTKDTDQAIIPEYGRIIDLMTIYNNYVIGACHSGNLNILTAALELIKIANNKQLIVKPTVLRYLVVACVRFKLHTSVKEFLQRGMTVSIYPTIDVHSNMLLLPTDLATEEIAALLLFYLMLLKEYLVQAMQVSKVEDDVGAGGVDVHQACSITVVPNNVNTRDHEFTQRYQLISTEYGLLQRVQSILTGSGNSLDETTIHKCQVDYLKSPISSEFSFEGGRSVLKLNTTEVYNNVYYIEPPSD